MHQSQKSYQSFSTKMVPPPPPPPPPDDDDDFVPQTIEEPLKSRGTGSDSNPKHEDNDKSTKYFDHGQGHEILHDNRTVYPWKKFIPSIKNPKEICKWIIDGSSDKSKLTDNEVEDNVIKLARLLSLLREYLSTYGMPEKGGPKEQIWVLTELCSQLYGSGAPLWVLKPVLIKAAEGMTGTRGADFILFTRSGIAHLPDSAITATFPMDRGFNMSKMTYAERILVRLASFASNTRAVHSVQSRSPKISELIKAARGQSVVSLGPSQSQRRQLIGKEILDLASEGIGLFYLTNQHADGYGDVKAKMYERSDHNSHDFNDRNKDELEAFWKVEPEICELFTRLATIESVASLDALHDIPKLYRKPLLILFQAISAIGAGGLWFKASWQDMIIAGILAVLVSLVSVSSFLKNEKVIYEVIVSYIVGLITGLITLSFPGITCFTAIALAAVIDIFQGFRIVYSIMEVCIIFYNYSCIFCMLNFLNLTTHTSHLFIIDVVKKIMSKHTISGGADFLEALMVTGFIAYFLKFGLQTAVQILGLPPNDNYNQCQNPIDVRWSFLLVPITSLSWALSFNPRYKDIALMTYHGILSYIVYWAVEQATSNSGLATFIAALTVSASAGFVSRFIGRQALGDAMTGLYVLVPGAYLARGMFNSSEEGIILDSGLLSNIIVIGVTVGLGGWTGTMLCSPTILGTNNGLLARFTRLRMGERKKRRGLQNDKHMAHVHEHKAMLFL